MKILFVNHNISLWINVGMTYVMTAVAKHHTVKLFDRMLAQQGFEEKLFDELRSFNPDAVTFSVNSYTQAEAAVLADEIKRKFPGVMVVFGGVHPTILPEESIVLKSVDAICIGEGERSMSEFFDAYEQRLPLNHIRGMWFKDANGVVVRNELRPFDTDIDALPFPNWDFWDIDAYMNQGEIMPGTLRVLTSRGCPFRCSFCTNAVWQDCIPGNYYRKRQPEKIVEEIEHDLKRYAEKGFRFLMISDSIFGLDKEHTFRFLDRYVEKGLHQRLPWGAQMRCSSIDEDVAAALKRAGCCRMNISIESGNDEMRNQVYQKNLSKDQIRRAVRALKKNGILVRAFVMIGGPGETNAMFDETLAFCRELGLSLSDLIIIRYAPLPKTELTQHIQASSITQLRSPFGYSRVAAVKSQVTKFYYLKLQVLKVAGFLKEGFGLSGLSFLKDLIGILQKKGKKRFIPLVYLCSEQRIINETLVVYKMKRLAGK